MNIVDSCANVLHEIENFTRRRQEHDDASKLRKRREDLAPIREELDADLQRLKILKGRSIAFKPLKLSATLFPAVEELSLNIDVDEATGRNVYGRAKTGVTKAAESAKNLVQAAIGSIETSLGAIDESFLKQLDAIPTMRAKASEARSKKEAFQKALQRRTLTPTDLAIFLDRRADLLSLVVQLQNEDLPSEVVDFFKAVHNAKATLDHLTPTVRDWLDEHGQLKDVRITMAK